MTDRPILFSAPMVRALLAGTKTQTRRVVKRQFAADAEVAEVANTTSEGWLTSGHSGLWWDDAAADIDSAIGCPYGVPGDRLWVRETWQAFEHGMDVYPFIPKRRPDGAGLLYAASDCDSMGWRPSIHMPRWASRITLNITGVRVERLQAISEADARAEGITPDEVRQFWLFGADENQRAKIYRDAAVRPFRALWEGINGAKSWGVNPWVWVVEFERAQA